MFCSPSSQTLMIRPYKQPEKKKQHVNQQQGTNMSRAICQDLRYHKVEMELKLYIMVCRLLSTNRLLTHIRQIEIHNLFLQSSQPTTSRLTYKPPITSRLCDQSGQQPEGFVPSTVKSLHCRHPWNHKLVSLKVKVHNCRNLFQSNVCTLFLPAI